MYHKSTGKPGQTRSGKRFAINLDGNTISSVPEREASSGKSMMSTNERPARDKYSAESKTDKPEICPIYEGKGYSMWRQRLKILLAKEGLKSLFRDSEDEKRYIPLTEIQRENTMPEYNDMQDRGRCLIMERLNDYYLRRINPTLTVRQIVLKLDEENIATSKVGLMVM